jgi:hypothetical protein
MNRTGAIFLALLISALFGSLQAQQLLNLGTAPNAGNGDTLFNGGKKINTNLINIYVALGGLSNQIAGLTNQVLAVTNNDSRAITLTNPANIFGGDGSMLTGISITTAATATNAAAGGNILTTNTPLNPANLTGGPALPAIGGGSLTNLPFVTTNALDIPLSFAGTDSSNITVNLAPYVNCGQISFALTLTNQAFFNISNAPSGLIFKIKTLQNGNVGWQRYFKANVCSNGFAALATNASAYNLDVIAMDGTNFIVGTITNLAR